MNRRAFIKAIGSATLLPFLPHPVSAATNTKFTRVRPSDAAWPPPAAWKHLNETVDGNLIHVDFPLSILKTDSTSDAAKQLLQNIKNPYYIRDHAGLTETLGWLDAWTTQPSVYAVAAENAQDIAAAVNFARDHNLRLAIKGGGHSYQGTSNARDSLLIWTRRMHDIAMHDAFIPQGCEHTLEPQSAVTVGAGTIGMQAYQAVTTKGGKYVQGGGCTTVCLGGLVQSAGFGSFSKHYGTAASSLLEAEVVTADGQIRIANACSNPDLFWALKGGGGGTFGVVSKMTLKLHDLPEFFGTANFKVKATSDEAYRRLVREFVSFYRESLFNDTWGGLARFRPDNLLEIEMLAHGLNIQQARNVWQPFLHWVNHSSDYSVKSPVAIGSIPARHYWDAQWWKEHWPEIVFPRNGWMHGLLDDVLVALLPEPSFNLDDRPGAGVDHFWWKGDSAQVAWFIWGLESLWLPATLLEESSQQKLADAMFSASRHSVFEVQFEKGLAAAPPEAIAATRDTATNPVVLTAFALAITGNAQGPAYPGIPGHQPSVDAGRKAALRVDKCISELRVLVPNGGAYVSESNYFQKDFQQAYWGSNYARLAEIKKKYDPEGLFIVHNGVGSEEWSSDGFTRL